MSITVWKCAARKPFGAGQRSSEVMRAFTLPGARMTGMRIVLAASVLHEALELLGAAGVAQFA
jgi:hypothetical protein